MLSTVFSQIAHALLRLCGWQLEGRLPAQSCVIVVAPHTSNWDFAILFLVALAFKAFSHAVWLAKHTLFWWPLGAFFRRLGGVPVNRQKPNKIIPLVSRLFAKRELMYFALSPEGTRKYTKHWKKGFYHIARRSKVPIALAFIDYKNKRVGMGPLLAVTGQESKDMAFIQNFYHKDWAKYPQKFSKKTSKTP